MKKHLQKKKTKKIHKKHSQKRKEIPKITNNEIKKILFIFNLI